MWKGKKKIIRLRYRGFMRGLGWLLFVMGALATVGAIAQGDNEIIGSGVVFALVGFANLRSANHLVYQEELDGTTHILSSFKEINLLIDKDNPNKTFTSITEIVDEEDNFEVVLYSKRVKANIMYKGQKTKSNNKYNKFAYKIERKIII